MAYGGQWNYESSNKKPREVGDKFETYKVPQLNNSVALAIERTLPTERPPLVGKVSAEFGG
jgi:hypothetical protein